MLESGLRCATSYSTIEHDGSPYGWLRYLRVMELEKLSVEEVSWGSV